MWCNWHSPLWSSSPKTHNHGLNHEKNIKKIPTEEPPTTYLSSPQTCQVIKNRRSLRNCHSQEEPKKIWQLEVIWHPGIQKNILSKTKKNLNKLWTSVANRGTWVQGIWELCTTISIFCKSEKQSSIFQRKGKYIFNCRVQNGTRSQDGFTLCPVTVVS